MGPPKSPDVTHPASGGRQFHSVLTLGWEWNNGKHPRASKHASQFHCLQLFMTLNSNLTIYWLLWSWQTRNIIYPTRHGACLPPSLAYLISELQHLPSFSSQRPMSFTSSMHRLHSLKYPRSNYFLSLVSSRHLWNAFDIQQWLYSP